MACHVGRVYTCHVLQMVAQAAQKQHAAVITEE